MPRNKRPGKTILMHRNKKQGKIGQPNNLKHEKHLAAIKTGKRLNNPTLFP